MALNTATALNTAGVGAPNLESYPVAARRRRLRPRLWIFPHESLYFRFTMLDTRVLLRN